MKEIKIQGAKVHNLKNINLSIPKNKLIALTGVSGSGKSSIALDIVFEEGRKQYLQSLGILSGIDNENKFTNIEGLGPTIAVQQNIIRQSNPRSIVGTRTNIINMLSLLYSGEGKASCSECENNEEHLEPRYFSCNSSSGMCLKCAGSGGSFEIDIKKLVSNNDITLKEVFERAKVTPGYMRILEKKFKEYFSMAFLELPEEIKNEVIYGHYENGKRSYCLIKIFESRYDKGEDLENIYAMTECSECQGFRVGEEARSVTLSGKHIGHLGKMSIMELHKFLEELLKKEELSQFGKNLVEDILIKTNNLIRSRLGYLSLYREMSTLSGGELQRLFLNTHLESSMDSLIYVLDEPMAGLHESEKISTLKSINKLKELGNTVIMVEHDKNTIKMAEHIIDIGPKAGICGGEVVYEGNLDGLLKCDKSITGKYLSKKATMAERITYRDIKINKEIEKITIYNANTNNLKDVTVSFPLKAMVGIAGKSGSGKSSLISDTLIPMLKSHFNNLKNNKFNAEEGSNRLEGIKYISGCAEISQEPIGRNSNSTPASYIGILDKIRTLFSKQPEAIERNFSAGHFSFNSKGACSGCGGSGYEKISLANNLNIEKICNECHGKRFNDETLEINYKNKNVYDILEMSVEEAVDFFEEDLNIVSTLKILKKIGMGYIKLGQPTSTLSGGEAQRIKLAKEIGKKRNGNILYILDEPTTGLSMYDIDKLIKLLDELIEKGNSVIVVEHNIDVLKKCDWIIELGPEGGEKGGYILSEGSPKELRNDSKSITGRYL